MGSPFKTFKMASSNLPPELIERMNKPQKHRFTSPFETSSGGFVPYTSMTRRSASLGATTLRNNPTIAHVSETSHWLTRHQIGDPAKTAWEINDRGNKVWFTYEHSPSIFPVKETRFYKPKLHTKNFMNPDEDDEENEKSI